MISLYDLIEAANGQLFGEPVAQLFDDFCLDADQAGENLLFVAMKSEHGDTHQYIPDAIEKGVSGVICHIPPECNTDGVSVILVKNTVTALLAWAHYILGKFGTKVIGVAGSAGKSIAVDAISRVLGLQYSVHTGMQTENTRISVPLALARLNSSHKFAVLELGTSQPGEMAAMIQAAQPEIGVVTHIGSLHTDHFETPDQVVREIGILVDYLSPSGLAVLNYDDDLVRSLATHTRAGVKTVGMASFGADMMVYNVRVSPEGTTFDLRCGSERYVGQSTPLCGHYHLYSVMAALTVGLFYGIPLADMLEVLKTIKPLPGRMNSLLGKSGALLVDNTYDANPQSTLAALDWLMSIKDLGRRVFFVFGDMGNLGRQSQVGHRKVGLRMSEVADVVVTQGTQAAMAARAALDHGMEPKHVHITYSTQDAVFAILNRYELSSNDVILLTGGSAARIDLVTKALLDNPLESANLVRHDASEDMVKVTQPAFLSWVEIDTDALAANVRQIKNMIGVDVTLMAVVKADAYGHGAVLVSRTALLNGASFLGVSSIYEALELRDAGIEAPILIMNYTPTYMARQAIQHNLTLTLYDLSMARSYDRIARESGKRLKVHIKLDSGMGRLGATASETIPLFRHLIAFHNLDIEGIYTHFSVADEDPTYTAEQLKSFRSIVRPIQATTGLKVTYLHAANSAATIAYPESHLDMVRTGIAMYGLHPSEHVTLPDGFEPVMTWKTVVAQVKTLPAEHPVGYGNTYITRREERVAVLPVGYADGFRRAPKSWGEVLIHGQRAPVIGRVSMEKLVVKVSHIREVAIGDEVVLMGRQRNATITAEEVARRIDTINYEVVTSILPRIPRR